MDHVGSQIDPARIGISQVLTGMDQIGAEMEILQIVAKTSSWGLKEQC